MGEYVIDNSLSNIAEEAIFHIISLQPMRDWLDGRVE
jgi:hypothetical protein